ncbi:MAG: acylphosphatase [Nitrospinae bacterium]|nr:acylphosphatase [Nitrospinota bacterium]
MSNARAHIIVSGIVQGVFFRANTRDTAGRLGVKGWVKNKYDGTVEIAAEGDKEKIERLVGWCHKGPQGAIVKDVTVEWEDYKGEFKDFSVRY